MKATLKVNEDMRWNKGDTVSFTINGTIYVSDVEQVVINSADDHYEYELGLTADWGEQ